MTLRHAAGALLGAPVLASLFACATSAPAAVSHQPDCAGFVAPKVISAPAVSLPPTLTSAQVGMDMPGEVVVARDGALGESHVAGADYAFVAPFADQALQRTRFSPASIDGNAVAARVPVIVPIGQPRKDRPEAVPPSIRAYVPGTESPEARW